MSIQGVLSGAVTWHVEIADVLAGLRLIPDGVVSCCITSPPYYGLRDYGTGQWDGGSPDCDHRVRAKGSGKDSSGLWRRKDGSLPPSGEYCVGHQLEGYRSTCGRCGARRIDQQIGLEDTPEAYTAKLVEVLREVKRCLHPTGTLWLNLGDSMCSSGGYTCQGETGEMELRDDLTPEQVRYVLSELAKCSNL